MTNTLLTLHDPEAARRYYDAGLWRADTLYTLLRDHATHRSDDFALRDGTRRLTWRALLALVDAVAADLDEAGLKRGERVSIWLPNRVEAVAILLACSRQGYVCNPSLHQNYTVGEITELLSRIRAAAFFAEPSYGADARTADIFAAPRRRPGQDRLSRFHLGHHRDTQGRHAFGQHLAGEWPGDGRRLASRRAHDPVEPQPDEPPHRHRRGRADDVGRARAGRQCAPARQ